LTEHFFGKNQKQQLPVLDFQIKQLSCMFTKKIIWPQSDLANRMKNICRRFSIKYLLLIQLCYLSINISNAQILQSHFINPPQSSRVMTWWHWENGHISREGITKDLEAMKNAGFGGAIMFNVGHFPEGSVTFMSDSWWDHLSHAIKEADRNELTFGIFNCDGWSMSGGPWIDVKESMKVIVWTDTDVNGGEKISIKLPQPHKNSIYEDIAVLAYPSLVNSKPLEVKRIMQAVNVEMPEALSDNDRSTHASFLPAQGDIISSVVFDFGKRVSIRNISFSHIASQHFLFSEAIAEYSLNGKDFQRVRGSVPLNYKPDGMVKTQTFSFPEIKARYVRIKVAFETSNPVTPVSTIRNDAIRIADIHFYEAPRVNLWEAKSGQSKRIRHDRQLAFIDEINTITEEELKTGWKINPDEIINLTEKLDEDGVLNWEAPRGNWTIQRIGYTSTHRRNAPATKAGLGFESDKMSAAATRSHFDGYVSKVIDLSNELIGKPIDYVQMESWEAGIQNWTEGFDKEFEKRRGYSLIPWLALITGGHIIDSYEKSNRFLWDFRNTVAELMSENYWDLMHQLCKEKDVEVLGEGSGMQHYLYDPIMYQRHTDIPMGEFWTSEGKPRADCKNAASVANTHGKTRVAAEAFTGSGSQLWRHTPYDFKKIGDEAFTMGVNQFVHHSYVHQPYEIPPGFTLNRFGNHFQRHNPWFSQAGGWFNYLARSQYLLQQGQTVSDVCYYTGEGIPAYLGRREELNPALPSGYDYDGVNLQLIKEMKVKEGKLVLPSGSSYHVLVFREHSLMSPELVKEIKRLVHDGATVLAPRPSASPSLSAYPRCDTEVQSLAKEIWGEIDGITVTENKFGKGRIIWGIPLNEILSRKDIPQDFTFITDKKDATVHYIHRKASTEDIYFIASDISDEMEAVCRFRVKNKLPELWDPDKGSFQKITHFSSHEDGIEITLTFDPLGSFFIVFRESVDEIMPGEAGRNHEELYTSILDSPWELDFQLISGESLKTTFNELIDWTEHPDPQIKYFSGSASYSKTFIIEDLADDMKIILDLGDVSNLATVVINGREMAKLWKPPYKTDISSALVAGVNKLEIIVTNTMVNRMIGDELLPQDVSYSPQEYNQRIIDGIPEWLSTPELRTSGRQTFVTYQYFHKDSPLEPSGLKGPVLIKGFRL
jgi:hypothetical protein